MSVQLGFIQLFTFVLFVANRFLFGLYFEMHAKFFGKVLLNRTHSTVLMKLLDWICWTTSIEAFSI